MTEIDKTDLPKGIGKPAEQAFSAAGYFQLEQFTQVSEKDILKLHGVGPKAVKVIQQALREKGWTFKE
ncbi:DNA-binding protein [Planomicrobium sp. CPCC 101079]|uniref:DNA-binding protein n=1 Tax=Planomicrobium sp. CPCC 101079 TaxID=2599618 RepID=UPI0011B65A59|nr:DNA-binding protein [Planomicrobium sp. CPCC 101079]TWT01418.1 DNA-binding protein [Planomicrobium sp. CPCC 101079]